MGVMRKGNRKGEKRPEKRRWRIAKLLLRFFFFSLLCRQERNYTWDVVSATQFLNDFGQVSYPPAIRFHVFQAPRLGALRMVRVSNSMGMGLCE